MAPRTMAGIRARLRGWCRKRGRSKITPYAEPRANSLLTPAFLHGSRDVTSVAPRASRVRLVIAQTTPIDQLFKGEHHVASQLQLARHPFPGCLSSPGRSPEGRRSGTS